MSPSIATLPSNHFLKTYNLCKRHKSYSNFSIRRKRDPRHGPSFKHALVQLYMKYFSTTLSWVLGTFASELGVDI